MKTSTSSYASDEENDLSTITDSDNSVDVSKLVKKGGRMLLPLRRVDLDVVVVDDGVTFEPERERNIVKLTLNYC